MPLESCQKFTETNSEAASSRKCEQTHKKTTNQAGGWYIELETV